MQSINDHTSRIDDASGIWWRRLLSLTAAVFVLGITSPVFATVDSYTVGVDGMACPFCAYGIEKKVTALEGVEALEIQMKKGELDVSAEGNGELSPADLHRAVQKAGFSLRSLAVTGTADIERSNGTLHAEFSEDLSFRVVKFDGAPGRLKVRGRLVRAGGDGGRKLRITEKIERFSRKSLSEQTEQKDRAKHTEIPWLWSAPVFGGRRLE